MQAALGYQHATTEADARVAASLEAEFGRLLIGWLVAIPLRFGAEAQWR